MSYNLIWQPFKSGWAIWSTVVDGFIYEGLATPEAVADAAVGNDEFYYIRDAEGYIRYEKNLEGELVPLVAICQYKSRQDIVDYFTRLLGDVHDTEINTLTVRGWEKDVTPANQVRANLERAFSRALEEWDEGTIRPDFQLKETQRRWWIEEAERVKREGIMTVGGTKFKITPGGLEKTGEFTAGPEVW